MKALSLNEKEIGVVLGIGALAVFVIWNVGFRILQAIFM